MDSKLEYIHSLYPNAKCELNFNGTFELLIAVCLSAQTTDIKVNKVTNVLFKKYPDCYSLSNANYDDVRDIIKPIGLANNKAKNIIELSKALVNEYNGIVPSDHDVLIKLPGVGNKTANVVMAVGFNIPAFPVDTHINRIAKRLKIAKIKDNVETVEKKMKKCIEKENWIQMHHSLIYFGRNVCKAINPNCQNCKLNGSCRKNYNE